MTVIKYAIKSKGAPEQPKDPKRIRLTYDMIMAPTKELHLSDSFYTFLTQLATPEVRKLFAALAQQTPERNRDMLLVRDDNLLPNNYFTLRRGGEPVISYLPHSKYKESEGSEWNKKTRQTMKPGRFLNSLVSEDTLKVFGITDAVIERFTNQVKSYVDVRVKLIEVQGDDIEYWYSPHRYSPKAGANLKKSCMNKDEFEATKFTFYMQNPNCSMLVAIDDEFKLMGRALVWHNCTAREFTESMGLKDGETKGITFMDRVYAGEDFVEEAFRMHAQEQGWYCREFAKYDYQTRLIAPNGRQVNMLVSCPSGLSVKLPDYPYVDSMKWVTQDLKTLYNYPIRTVKTYGIGAHETLAPAQGSELVHTDLDGPIHPSNVVTCLHCKKTGSITSMYGVGSQVGDLDKRVCRNCYNKNYVQSNFEGRLIPKDEAVEVSYAGGMNRDYVSKGNAVYSKHHRYYMIKAYARHLPIDDDWVSRHDDIVPSAFHNCFIFRSNAVWTPELSSFVHQTRARDAKEAIEAGCKTQAELEAHRKASATHIEPPAEPLHSHLESVA